MWPVAFDAWRGFRFIWELLSSCTVTCGTVHASLTQYTGQESMNHWKLSNSFTRNNLRSTDHSLASVYVLLYALALLSESPWQWLNLGLLLWTYTPRSLCVLPAAMLISTEAVFPSSYLHRKVTQPRSGGNIPWGSIHKLEMRDERDLVGTFFCLFLPGNNRSLLRSEGQLRSSTAHTPSLFAHLPCFVSFFPHTSFPGLHTSIKNQHITFSLSLCF